MFQTSNLDWSIPVVKIHKQITQKKLQIPCFDESLWMSPSPAGWPECWVSRGPTSPTSQLSNLPPHFRPPDSWVSTPTVWSPFFSLFLVLSSFRWFQTSGVSICLFLCTYGFVCLHLYVCLYVSPAISTVKLTVCDSWRSSDWTPVTRVNQILSLCVSSLHTYLVPLVPLVHRQQKYTHKCRHSYRSISLVICISR